MPLALNAESTLTDRYQTTVPKIIRSALRLGKRDKIRYTIRPTGEVILTRAAADAEEVDPALGQFLELLADDIAKHPANTHPIDMSLVLRARELTDDVKIDIDAPLSHDEK